MCMNFPIIILTLFISEQKLNVQNNLNHNHTILYV